MRGIGSVFNRPVGVLVMLSVLAGCIAGCSRPGSEEPIRTVTIQQSWELQPGDEVGGYTITGSLGDVSIALNGGTVYAPFDGRVQPNDIPNCLIYSSPEVPAYVFRLCGLESPQLGPVRQGAVIGKGKYLQFAALRRQPDGTWAMVEPSGDILQRALQRP